MSIPTVTSVSLVRAAIRSGLALLIAMMSLSPFGAGLLAQTGSVLSLPAGPPNRNKTGVVMSLDPTWVDGSGYRPVKVAITTLAPAKADRAFEVELAPSNWYGQKIGTVSQEIVIPSGTLAGTTVRTTILVPQMPHWNNCQVTVFEGGSEVEQLSSGAFFVSPTGPGQLEETPRALFVHDPAAAYDVKGFIDAFPQASVNFGTPATSNPAVVTTSSLVGRGTMMALQRGDLPDRWLEYTSFDLIVMPWKELEALPAQNPAQWAAIQDWLHAGGNLVVFGLGPVWERLAELDKLLRFEPPGDGEDESLFRGWKKPLLSSQGAPNLDGSGPVAGTEWTAAVDANGQPITRPGVAKAVQSRSEYPDKPGFLVRDCQLGRVVALPDDKLMATSNDWGWLLNTLGPDRWLWNAHHGVSYTQANPDFWEFLIPGVGLAPVNPFRVLITMFVLVIGPVNYYLLRRWKRLHLLVFTVPVGAAVVTLSLFVYAILVDGIDTRVRARSYTELDQQSGRAVSWVRLSYYAGLAPSGGLVFSDETAVYPIEPEAGDFSRRRNTGRAMYWDTEQHLARGWLRARVPTQFMTVHCGPSNSALNVIEDMAGNQLPKVVNQLGTRIEALLVIDSKGNQYSTAEIEEGAAAALTAVAADAMPLSKPYVSNLPILPGTFDTNRRNSLFFNSRSFYQSAIGTTQKTSRLEGALRIACQQSKTLPARSYVALVERPHEVELGTSAAQEEASFHVIMGRW